MQQRNGLPGYDAVLAEIRKPSYADPRRVSLYIRGLLWVQRFVTLALIRSRASSRLVTFSWFLVALAAYAVTAYGAVWCFSIGALLVYVKLVLDISDGEVGRYQKRFMDSATDLRTHMQGLYLDRMQHIVESPLWGLALGFGVFRLTGSVGLLLCGLCLGLFQALWRIDALLRRNIALMFARRVSSEPGIDAARVGGDERTLRTVLRNGFDKLTLWVRNGKRFNLLVLFCGLLDLCAYRWVGEPICMSLLLAVAAAVAVIAAGRLVLDSQFSPTLVQDSMQLNRNVSLDLRSAAWLPATAERDGRASP